MFYKLKEPCSFNGKDEYLDVSEKLHYFLQAKTIGIRAVFSLNAANYGTLFAVYHPDYFLPDFSICVNMGYLTVVTRCGGREVIWTDTQACNDGRIHELVVNGQEDGLAIWLDGRLVGRERDAVPWCEFGYVTIASVGRGIVQNQFRSWFEGEIHALEIGTEPAEPSVSASASISVKTPLFYRGLAGVENYRIPALLVTPSGVMIATADARMETPGDNPNHIVRAVRRSLDSGETWEDVRLFADFGGVGIEGGAAAIDGQMLMDDATGTIFMIYSHTPAGIGSRLSEPGTGYESGRRVLTAKDGSLYYQQPDGKVTRDVEGNATGYTVDAYDRLYRDGAKAGSVCLKGGELSIAPTSFLQIVSSTDDGKTWSEPKDLNPMVKAPWMRFLGPGPGTGICIREGRYQGRLVCPVYYSNPYQIYSSGVIYSDDHGETWRMGQSANDGRICDGEPIHAESVQRYGAMLGECQVTELAGGILKLFMRNPRYQRVVSAVSTDGGESWTEFRVEDSLVNPFCQFHLLRTEIEGEGTMYLFSGPDHEFMRVRGRIWSSRDGAETFRRGALLECGEFAYSCMALLPDGTVGILYEGRDMTLYFMKAELESCTDCEAFY